MLSEGFSTLKILATVKQEEFGDSSHQCFSTLKILATVKLNLDKESTPVGFSTLKILATVKLLVKLKVCIIVLVPLRL